MMKLQTWYDRPFRGGDVHGRQLSRLALRKAINCPALDMTTVLKASKNDDNFLHVELDTLYLCATLSSTGAISSSSLICNFGASHPLMRPTNPSQQAVLAKDWVTHA